MDPNNLIKRVYCTLVTPDTSCFDVCVTSLLPEVGGKFHTTRIYIHGGISKWSQVPKDFVEDELRKIFFGNPVLENSHKNNIFDVCMMNRKLLTLCPISCISVHRIATRHCLCFLFFGPLSIYIHIVLTYRFSLSVNLRFSEYWHLRNTTS